MPDKVYCYEGTDILKNKLNIKDKVELFETETEFTSIRADELQENPIKGNFDFAHLKAIHRYFFQDLYDWAGQERTVEIGKGNLFCTTRCISSYADSVFRKYFPECYQNRNNVEKFVKVFAQNYADLNALHPFREGNGRAQREFARELCLKCGYDFNLNCTTHKEMLAASVLSFNELDCSGLINIFSKAISKHDPDRIRNRGQFDILTSTDLLLNIEDKYEYGYDEYDSTDQYNAIYLARIDKMNRENEVGETITTFFSEPTEEDLAEFKHDEPEQDEFVMVEGTRSKDIKDPETNKNASDQREDMNHDCNNRNNSSEEDIGNCE